MPARQLLDRSRHPLSLPAPGREARRAHCGGTAPQQAEGLGSPAKSPSFFQRLSPESLLPLARRARERAEPGERSPCSGAGGSPGCRVCPAIPALSQASESAFVRRSCFCVVLAFRQSLFKFRVKKRHFKKKENDPPPPPPIAFAPSANLLRGVSPEAAAGGR